MTAPRPNTAEAIEFLIRYRGSNPVVLTSIDMGDSFPFRSRTFRPALEFELLRNWLDARQGLKNLHFLVNPTLHPVWGQRKPRVEDVRGVMALQVDIDPRPGEELKQERARALADLRPFNPPPSFIIDSGGGFQGFWLLDEDRPNVDEDSAAQLERYNRQVALQLGGDLCCYEIDSLMRLPGAINVPQGKKIDQGRVPALARLVEFHDGRRYPLRAFTAARKVKRRWTWDPELRDAAQTEQPETDEGCEFKIPF